MSDRISSLDSELVAIIKDFLLLAPLSWNKETMATFMRSVRKGNMVLPKVSYDKKDYSDKITTLTAYIKKLGHDEHPAMFFLRETAQSYLDAYRVLQGIGTQDVSEFSKKLYGSPKDILPGYKRRSVDVARYFLRVVGSYKGVVSDEPLIYSATTLRDQLKKKLAAEIDMRNDPIVINIDGMISARATAGSNYVKIRKGARFSRNDMDQLFHHEIMVHTLTYINGRKQTFLKALGYNAPRTAATQEGLAVFAEYINSSIELVRLMRIAQRIIAIDMAEKGANFIDLFKFYNQHGQNQEESYYSAMRIFRGGSPEGGIIFYKDNVYLRGLIEVSTFFKSAMHQGFIHDIALLFSGKLCTQDVQLLKPMAKDGLIIDPAYMPDWAKRTSQLAAHLALNDISERFK